VLKRAQRGITKGKASRLCYLAANGAVIVTVGELLIAHVSGIHRCGSIWNCPLCAPVVRQGRAKDIDRAAARVLEMGGCGLFVTYTGPHRKFDPLAPLFDLTCRFGELTMTGAKAKRLRVDLGLLGSIRALEITYGRPPFDNGWHPHGHVLFLFDRQLTPEEVAAFRAFLWQRWNGALLAAGFRGLHPVKGLDARPIYDTAGLAEYTTAVEDGWGVGLELARADLKHRGQTPMELLGLWALLGETHEGIVARMLWKEYEEVTFNRRCIQWSPGLRARLLPEEKELTDVELAVAEGEDDEMFSFVFVAEEWNGWCRRGEVAQVLREIEEVCAVSLFLARFGSTSKENADAEVTV